MLFQAYRAELKAKLDSLFRKLENSATMSRSNELYAYFTITGEFDPADVSARLGTEPTESWTKGDLNPKNGKERTFSRWSLYSRLDRNCELEEHIRDVLEQLRAKSEGFRTISEEFGGHLEVVGYFYSHYPGLFLDKEDIAAISEFGLSVDFDYYYMYPDRREDT